MRLYFHDDLVPTFTALEKTDHCSPDHFHNYVMFFLNVSPAAKIRTFHFDDFAMKSTFTYHF